jgi:transposase
MARSGRWEEVGERFIELDAAGKSARQIREELGVSERCVNRWRRRLGTSQESPPRHPPEHKDIARALVEDGCPKAEIARTINAGVETIARWFPDAEWWTPQETMRFARDTRAVRPVAGKLSARRPE